MDRSPRALARAGAALLLLLGLSACATRQVESPGLDPDRGVAPALVVERFMQAANVVAIAAEGTTRELNQSRAELETMARLFGTPRGPVATLYPRDEVEQRMVLLASILRHEDYRLEGEALVPGRVGEAIRIMVRIRRGEMNVTVPFTLVQSSRHGWLIEQFDAERITSSD